MSSTPGFGPDSTYVAHRLGHGIGMDGHEWTYLVRGNTTRLRSGMGFSNEPGIYIYGEMSIRHEERVLDRRRHAQLLKRASPAAVGVAYSRCA